MEVNNFTFAYLFLLYFNLKDLIDDKLDPRQFPSLGGQRNAAASYAVQRYFNF